MRSEVKAALALLGVDEINRTLAYTDERRGRFIDCLTSPYLVDNNKFLSFLEELGYGVEIVANCGLLPNVAMTDEKLKHLAAAMSAVVMILVPYGMGNAKITALVANVRPDSVVQPSVAMMPEKLAHLAKAVPAGVEVLVQSDMDKSQITELVRNLKLQVAVREDAQMAKVLQEHLKACLSSRVLSSLTPQAARGMLPAAPVRPPSTVRVTQQVRLFADDAHSAKRHCAGMNDAGVAVRGDDAHSLSSSSSSSSAASQASSCLGRKGWG
jgi:hypothetical protein